MKKAAFVTGLIGLSFFTIGLIWETIRLIQQLLFDLSNIRISDNDISIEPVFSTRFVVNLLFTLLIFATVITFVVLFIRTILQFHKGKPVKTVTLIILLIFSVINILAAIPSQMTAIPQYLVVSRLGWLDTVLTLYVPIFFSFIASALMTTSLIIMLATKRKSCKQ